MNFEQIIKELLVQVLPLLVNLLGALLSYIAWRVGQWATQQYQAAQAKVGEKNFTLLVEFAKIVVKALEQTALKQKLEMTKEQMKAEAMKQLQAWADQFHIPVDATVLSDVIEAVIRDGFHKGTDSGTVQPTEPSKST